MEKTKADGPRVTNSNVRKVIRLWVAFNFFIAPIRDGLNPFVSVYLVAVVGLNPGIAGLIWFVRDLALMISQVPFGFLFDHTSNKKFFIFLCTTVCTFTPLIIIWSTNVPILMVKTILEGLASSGLAVSKGPFTLGISGHDLFAATSKNTEVAEHAGAFVAALVAGCVAYALYPAVELLFYVIALFGFIACICILLMPTNSTPGKDGSTFIIVDDDLARNSDKTTVKEKEVEIDVDEFHDDTNPNKHGLAKDEGPISTWKTISTDKNISFFALAIFFFHLGNAAILPLLGQVLALDSGRAGIPYTAANIVTAQISSIGAAYALDYYVAKGVRINTPILIGFGSQALRIGIILVLSYLWPNEYALVATQLLDGLGAGVNGLGIVLITNLLTKGKNNFGVVFSIINICHFTGAALSNLISGFIVTATSYEIGFISLLCPILLSLILIILLEVPSDWDKSAEEVDPSIDATVDPSIDAKNEVFSDFKRSRRSSIGNSMRPSILSSSIDWSVQIDQPERRRSSIAVSTIERKPLNETPGKGRRSSAVFDIKPEIVLTQATKGRRMSSILIKYEQEADLRNTF